MTTSAMTKDSIAERHPTIGSSPVRSVVSIDHRGGRIVAGTCRAASRMFPFGGNRYVTYVASRLGARLAKKATCTVELDGGGRFTFPMGDKYWLKLLMRGFWYEPEVDTILSLAARETGCLVIDCGANFGYWVARLAGFPQVRMVAVEPSASALVHLRANVAANGDRVTLYDRAVWREDDQELSFMSSAKLHAGSALAGVVHHDIQRGDWQSNRVRTVSIDSLAARHGDPDCSLIVVKLDVEGAEVDAIAGATSTIQRDDFVLVYEDHPSDTEHRITRELIAAGLQIHHASSAGLRKIEGAERMGELKSARTARYNFYNFIACRPGGPAERFLSRNAANFRC